MPARILVGTASWADKPLQLAYFNDFSAGEEFYNKIDTLRGAKRNYESLVAATNRFTRPGDVILTNLWWFDQVNGALHGTRTFLYAGDSAAASRALATLRAERITAVTLAWSAEAAESPFPLEAALDGTCFRAAAARQVALREVRLAAARCDNGADDPTRSTAPR